MGTWVLRSVWSRQGSVSPSPAHPRNRQACLCYEAQTGEWHNLLTWSKLLPSQWQPHSAPGLPLPQESQLLTWPLGLSFLLLGTLPPAGTTGRSVQLCTWGSWAFLPCGPRSVSSFCWETHRVPRLQTLVLPHIRAP